MAEEQDLVPATPPTLQQLQEAIELRLRRVTEATPTGPVDLDNYALLGDGYVACIEAMRDAAVMAFNYVAAELGVTGFQASVAALQAYGMEMGIDGPFMFLRLEDALYPQYDVIGKVNEWVGSESSRTWLREQAQKKLSISNRDQVASAVWERWQTLAQDTE